MDGGASEDFRFALRAATRGDHDRVDRLVTGLDIATRAGFARFAQVHLACFRAVQDEAPSATLAAMVSALRADLAKVAPAARVSVAVLGPVDPLAAAYMVEGSRMGTRVLHGRWAASKDALVRAADRYFGLPPDKGGWRAVTSALGQVAIGSPRAARIEADTRRLFALFADRLEAEG
ncbi:Heme oxygenase [Jannaschia seohaensis]|uniref:Heme oxygenase n=2 Tax=Jannaschia seohaensis TaxID=475081 RepID=A0A2Y9C7S4_9RHOB|nr:heme oxygenase [Jannaschia seohaensis]SSA46603.1 Heme oxygenase [Jannaschia seohaensis]